MGYATMGYATGKDTPQLIPNKEKEKIDAYVAKRVKEAETLQAKIAKVSWHRESV